MEVHTSDSVLRLLAIAVLLVALSLAGVGMSTAPALSQQAPSAAPSASSMSPAIELPDNAAPAPTETRQVVLKEGARIATGNEENPVAYITYKTPYEYWLTGLTIAVLIAALAALTIMGWRQGLTQEFVRAFIVIVIVFAALFLIAAGYSDKQAAPVYGLLGTIAGYIFGRLTSDDESKKQRSDAAADDKEAAAEADKKQADEAAKKAAVGAQ